MPGRRRRLLRRLLWVATGSQVVFVAAVFAGAREYLSATAMIGVIFLARLAYAVTASGVFPTVQAWLRSERAATVRQAALTRMSATVNAGRVVVPLLAAVAALRWPSAALVLVLLVLLPLVAVSLLPPERPSLETTSAPTPARQLPTLSVTLPVACPTPAWVWPSSSSARISPCNGESPWIEPSATPRCWSRHWRFRRADDFVAR